MGRDLFFLGLGRDLSCDRPRTISREEGAPFRDGIRTLACHVVERKKKKEKKKKAKEFCMNACLPA